MKSDETCNAMRIDLPALGSPKYWGRALILAGLALSVASASAAVPSEHRDNAVAAYEKAQQMRATLEARAEGNRPKEEYRKVIDAFFQVYRLDPAYSKAPVALAAVAALNQEMGREFSSDAYYLEAIKSFRFLMKQYPNNRIARGAMFTIGEIYRQDLEDPDEARKAFQDFITMYPKSDKADEAQGILKELDTQPSERAGSGSPPPR